MLTMGKFLVQSIGFLCLWTLSRGGVPVSVQCGETKDVMINVTYRGEAFAVYLTGNEQDCVFKEDTNNPTVKTFQGANKNNCGLKWDENLQVYTFAVRVQAGFVISEADEVFGVTCAYGSTARPQTSFSVIDPNFLSGPVSTIDNLTDIQLTVLNANGLVTSELKHGIDVKLRVNGTGLTSNTIDVWSCSITDSVEEEPGLKIRFLHQSCGTRYFNNNASGFTGSSETELESDVFQVSNTFYGPHYFLCCLTICFLNCTQGCQTPYRPQSGALQQVWVTTPVTILETLTTTTTVTPTVTPPVTSPTTYQQGETVTTDYLEVQMPFIISLSILTLLVLILVAVVFLVYKGASKYSQYQVTCHAPSVSDVPSSCSACANQNEDLHCFYHYLNSPVSESSSSSSSSCRKQAVKPSGRNRKRNSLKMTYRFTPYKATGDNNYRFYMGRGLSYKRPVNVDPTMLRKTT